DRRRDRRVAELPPSRAGGVGRTHRDRRADGYRRATPRAEAVRDGMPDGEPDTIDLVDDDRGELRSSHRSETGWRDLQWRSWIVGSTDDAIISVSTDERIVTWNRGAERLLGYTADEIVGRALATIVPGAMLGEERRLLRRVYDGERVEQRRTLRQHYDGTLVPVRLTTSPIHDDDQTVVGVSIICHDITEEQEHEDRLVHQA